MQVSTTKLNFDSAFCGSLPLNIINTIQPYGVLVVLDPETHHIIQISENCKEIFDVESSELLNKPFIKYLNEEELDKIDSKLFRKDITEAYTINLSINNIFCSINVHNQAKEIILELEPTNKDSNFHHLYQEVKFVVATLKNANTIEDVCRIVAEEIKRISGFDKVMIYQFDPNWNGVVIAEAKESDMDTYLGLYFPASDVPKQARELYFKNPYRYIPNAKYSPIPLVPLLNPNSYTFTDLAYCNLRGVAAVHLEYLSNMKVGASMSTPIIKNDKLWGLISCHHKSARPVSVELRSSFELLSNIISTQLSFKEREKELMYLSNLETTFGELYKSMASSKEFQNAFVKEEYSLLSLLDITGAAVFYGNNLVKLGITPESAEIKEILFWLKINKVNSIFTTESLDMSSELEKIPKDIASGIIAIPINPDKGDYLLGFRPELIEMVHWGGNPNNAIQFEEDKQTYHPRNSFSIWKETVRNISKSWEKPTLVMAEKLQKSILEIILSNSLK